MKRLGVVLAGGRSSRFGSDKARAMLDGRALIDHARDTIAPFVDAMATDIPDHPAPGLGPLGGLCGALRHAKAQGFDAVMVTACDIPLLPSDVVPKLIDAAPAFLLEAPVVGCWPVGLSNQLEAFLGGEDRSMHAWARACAATGIASDPIHNINRPADLTSAQPTPKPNRPAFFEAIAIVERHVATLPAETIALTDALGRVTAAPVQAQRFHPAADMSAMDGFVLTAADCTGGDLAIGDPIFAGDASAPLPPGTACPIMTGAIIPTGGATVLIKERATVEGDRLRITEPVATAMNIRSKGEDAAPGDEVLGPGRAISAPMLGALVAYGVETIAVRLRPRVSIIPTGDELGGGIIDVNGPMIAALLAETGAAVTLSAPVPDSREAIASAIAAALATSDFVITTGGASAGERDHIPDAVRDVGATIHFHGVRMRPGKPVLFATTPDGVPILGLPGNPVASLVGCRFFGMAALRRMLGLPSETGRAVTSAVLPTNGVTNITRVVADDGPISPLPGDRPHMMRSLLTADHWMVQLSDTEQATLFPLTDRLR
ncbi:molybdopterin-binding protein [Sphingomonas montanisoli]|uniref:Molybdopterin molybdenumtransferase n=1 Tax=Sphingomonas montanisoli TaxID=2606412 RepID=A0A5D9C9Y6_9SPHN|nr:molybdopterin-binding protein [Sphingomonas montanisoli]TZG27870.1 NTP transferase domain-containing protein [Sphingomonas montanisoli]